MMSKSRYRTRSPVDDQTKKYSHRVNLFNGLFILFIYLLLCVRINSAGDIATLYGSRIEF